MDKSIGHCLANDQAKLPRLPLPGRAETEVESFNHSFQKERVGGVSLSRGLDHAVLLCWATGASSGSLAGRPRRLLPTSTCLLSPMTSGPFWKRILKIPTPWLRTAPDSTDGWAGVPVR